jgi:AraC family transcriptional activator of tynA and feaB
MQVVYTYSGRDVAESRRTLDIMVRNEFTDGDVAVEATEGEFRTFIRKGLNQPIQFMRSLNGAAISFRRCWHHIHARRAASRLLYFVYQGDLQVVSSAASYTVRPSRCCLINADEPFYTRAAVGDRGTFECALAVVPEHLVLSHMPWAKGLTSSFEIGLEHRQIVTSLLNLLCFEGDHMSTGTATPIAEAFLRSISDGIGDQFASTTVSGNLIDKRFSDIKACIQKYVTSSDLTSDRVAAYCGISTRYLCHVLKANNTSFSDLLWSQRLPKAREWLVADTYRRYTIHKISSMAGFKSAAHFSRMFKSAYRVSPKEYRVHHQEGKLQA